MSTSMIELNANELAEVLASSRTRGQYKETLDEFLGGDSPGVEISLKDGAYAGKKPETVKQGFANVTAKNGYADKVRTIFSDNRIFLVRK